MEILLNALSASVKILTWLKTPRKKSEILFEDKNSLWNALALPLLVAVKNDIAFDLRNRIQSQSGKPGQDFPQIWLSVKENIFG